MTKRTKPQDETQTIDMTKLAGPGPLVTAMIIVFCTAVLPCIAAAALVFACLLGAQ